MRLAPWHPTQADLDKRRNSFWSKVAISAADACWLWRGAIHNGGYGYVVKRGSGKRRTTQAHRIALMLVGAQVTPDDLVLHSCDVKLCCNPSHLRAGTQSDNMRDRGKRQRHTFPRGEANGSSRLTTVGVLEIRRMREDGMSQDRIAKQFGIAQTTVSAIVTGKSWSC